MSGPLAQLAEHRPFKAVVEGSNPARLNMEFNTAAFQSLFKSVKELFANKIFLATLITLCTAQVSKTIIFLLRGRRGKLKELAEITMWRTGGMPSSHAAVVACLTSSIAFKEGIASNLFIFSFWFTLVVIRDALGVRRSAGLLAMALNNMGKKITEKLDFKFHPVKEIQGHSPLEVAVGLAMGIFIAVILHIV